MKLLVKCFGLILYIVEFCLHFVDF